MHKPESINKSDMACAQSLMISILLEIPSLNPVDLPSVAGSQKDKTKRSTFVGGAYTFFLVNHSGNS